MLQIEFEETLTKSNCPKDETSELLKKILSNQISDKKIKYADFVINNNGPKNKTKQALRKILDKIMEF